MKKILVLLLAAALLLTAAACSKDNTNATPPASGAQGETIPIPQGETTPIPQGETEPAPESGAPATETPQPQPTAGAMTVVDNDQISIVIDEVVIDDFWGFSIKCTLENRTEDKNLSFVAEDAVLNGLSFEPALWEELAPGEKKEDCEIDFIGNDEIEEILGTVTDIELYFEVTDNDDYMADPIYFDSIHYYPYGQDKATVYVREPEASDKVLVDNEVFTLILTGFEDDDFWGFTTKLYVTNKTDKTLSLSCSDVLANGQQAGYGFMFSLPGGSSTFHEFHLADNLEELGITKVDEIQIKLNVNEADADTWESLFSDTITMNP